MSVDVFKAKEKNESVIGLVNQFIKPEYRIKKSEAGGVPQQELDKEETRKNLEIIENEKEIESEKSKASLEVIVDNTK